jgi:DNA-binding response OmpR family regulator
MIHILLIDDEYKLTAPLCGAFERSGYRVSVAHDGQVGLKLALSEKPDVIVLDVMMPGLDGWEVCQAVREHSIVPIIMLTALDDSMDRIKGLELGADDYLVKPFGFKELEAHVRAMLRRIRFDQGQQFPQSITVGEMSLNLEAHQLLRDGLEIILRQKEFEILTLLMLNIGKVVTRERLFDEVWGTDWLGDTRTLDVHMSWLRAKLEADPTNPVYLQTVRGVGYRFHDPSRS